MYNVCLEIYMYELQKFAPIVIFAGQSTCKAMYTRWSKLFFSTVYTRAVQKYVQMHQVKCMYRQEDFGTVRYVGTCISSSTHLMLQCPPTHLFVACAYMYAYA